MNNRTASRRRDASKLRAHWILEIAESTAERDCVVSITCSRYSATCSTLAGKGWTLVLEEAKFLHLWNALLYAFMVPGALGERIVDSNLDANCFRDGFTQNAQCSPIAGAENI